MNLLRMVQLILSSMESDEVNDISDTVESRMVVDIIEQSYLELYSNLDFPENWDFFELDPSNDPDKPTLMYVPADVAKIEYIRYDFSELGSTKRNFLDVSPLDRRYFFERMSALDAADENVYSYDLLVGADTFDVRGFNDRAPVYYTTNNDRTLIFDNYDEKLSNTLVSNKTWCYGMKIPVFRRDNTYEPELPLRQLSLLFNEAKAQAFLELKQIENVKAERRARRGWNMAHRKSPGLPNGDIRPDWTPNYGRK